MYKEIFITGDKHGDFSEVTIWSHQLINDRNNSIIIVLGDSGLNFSVNRMYYGMNKLYEENNTLYKASPFNRVIYRDSTETVIKKNILKDHVYCDEIFVIHGNHEARAETVEGYETKEWNGGIVYFQPEYPNILFAKDGEIYTINGETYFVCGGAYSIDKEFRLRNYWNWFFDEQPDDEIKERAIKNLEKADWKVDYVLSHTCPYKYIPTETFDNSTKDLKVDNSTEKWLDEIEEKLDYKKWYCGHFHINKHQDNIVFLFNSVERIGK